MIAPMLLQDVIHELPVGSARAADWGGQAVEAIRRGPKWPEVFSFHSFLRHSFPVTRIYCNVLA
jgi:hypothetical protein